MCTASVRVAAAGAHAAARRARFEVEDPAVGVEAALWYVSLLSR